MTAHETAAERMSPSRLRSSRCSEPLGRPGGTSPTYAMYDVLLSSKHLLGAERGLGGSGLGERRREGWERGVRGGGEGGVACWRAWVVGVGGRGWWGWEGQGQVL